MMLVSVVIPAYNEELMIKRCLDSVRAQTYKDIEIVVCDNNSTDRTVSIAEQHADKVVREKQQGPVFALDRGAREASGDIVAFTGADCMPQKDWIESLVKGMDGCLGVIGPIWPIEDDDRCRRAARLVNSAFRAANMLKIPAVYGVNCAFKASALRLVGFYNTSLPVMEDLDLCRRIMRLGRVRWVPHAIVQTSFRRDIEVGVARLCGKRTKQALQLFLTGEVKDVKETNRAIR
jgi:glycosyltransferase involved in cell wall biosynthesis